MDPLRPFTARDGRSEQTLATTRFRSPRGDPPDYALHMDTNDTIEQGADEETGGADEVVTEVLVEEVSIDGMCGVY